VGRFLSHKGFREKVQSLKIEEASKFTLILKTNPMLRKYCALAILQVWQAIANNRCYRGFGKYNAFWSI